MLECEPPHSEMNALRAMILCPRLPPPTLTEPERWSKTVNAFIAAALVKDPAARPNVDQMLAHQFVAQQLDCSCMNPLLALRSATLQALNAEAELAYVDELPTFLVHELNMFLSVSFSCT